MNPSEFHQKTSAASKPVVVDFWAGWCAPCKMTKPILEKLAQEYNGSVEFLPVNADDSTQVLKQLRVFGLPTVLAFRDGREISRMTGAKDEASYRAMFEALAAGKEITVPIAPFDRLLRLGAGLLLVIVGIYTSSWLVAVIGSVLAFLGVYDRCPIWAAIKGKLHWK
jgi:thioredoxin 1